MESDASPASGRSPLAMVVLALLAESPMHVYRMQHLIKERAQDKLVNVGSRNSLHQVAQRLERDGLTRVLDAGAPRGRTTYALTPDGAEALDAWLRDMIVRPRRDYPSFPAALAFVTFREPLLLAEHLERRAEALREELSGPTPAQVAEDLGLPRVFLLEDEYTRAMAAAELAWVEGIAVELRSGALTWPPATIGAAPPAPPNHEPGA